MAEILSGFAEAPVKFAYSPRPAPSTMDRVAITAMERVFKAWGVGQADAAKLAGATDRTWARMRDERWGGTLSGDQTTRASALVGLYKGLHLYFSDELADKWVKMPNRGPLFQGASPLAFMIAGGLLAIVNTREYIDAVRGGV